MVVFYLIHVGSRLFTCYIMAYACPEAPRMYVIVVFESRFSSHATTFPLMNVNAYLRKMICIWMSLSARLKLRQRICQKARP